MLIFNTQMETDKTSPDVSPDVSPRKIKVKHFVIVKEYMQQPKAMHPQYLEKTILKEQVAKKDERNSLTQKIINYVTYSSPESSSRESSSRESSSRETSPETSCTSSPRITPNTSPLKRKQQEVIVRNVVTQSKESSTSSTTTQIPQKVVEPRWWAIRRHGMALFGGLLLAGSMGLLVATNNKTSTGN